MNNCRKGEFERYLTLELVNAHSDANEAVSWVTCKFKSQKESKNRMRKPKIKIKNVILLTKKFIKKI